VTALVLLLLGGFAIFPRIFAQRPTDPLTTKDAPDFTLKVLANAPSAAPGNASDNPTLTMSELRGKAVVLDFWASWCGPCQQEAPIVDKVSQRFKDRGLVVVGVNTSDAESAGRAWAVKRGLSFTIVYDQGEAAARAYGVENLPTLVVVSRTGKVVAVRTGVTDDSELERLVNEALST
jgi:thiol-disulfide isomerase/thioredoxin